GRRAGRTACRKRHDSGRSTDSAPQFSGNGPQPSGLSADKELLNFATCHSIWQVCMTVEGCSMTTDTMAAETRTFEADVARLLHMMVHSVYSDRDVFLRELISNAAEACEKLRYEAISRPEL